jgi:hypothetical protein
MSGEKMLDFPIPLAASSIIPATLYDAKRYAVDENGRTRPYVAGSSRRAGGGRGRMSGSPLNRRTRATLIVPTFTWSWAQEWLTSGLVAEVQR